MANSPELLFRFGTELLNAGENEQALETFNRVEQLSRGTGAWSSVNELNVRLNQAVSHLRMAERVNCLSNHNADSCLVPIKGGGIHKWQTGSRNAMGVLTNLLQNQPDNLSARWLLNIAAMTVGDYPEKVPARWLIPPATFNSDYDIKRFVDVAGPAGLAVNELSGGSATEDFDGDGLPDVMITSIGLRDQMHFFHNNGDGTFNDRTREAGLIGLIGGLNMITGDYNNDGFVDVFVLRGAWMREEGKFPNSLLKNNGDGTFEDVTEAAGVLSFHPTQTAVWFDFNGDGWLDLFIGNESTQGSRNHPCELYRNNRNGTFTEIAQASGVSSRAYVKGVGAGDFNNDGRPDLYLSTKGRANLLFRNDGPGTNGGWRFTEMAAEAGVQMPMESFPTWFFDYDNDGWEDIFVSGYQITDVGDIAADYLGLPSKGSRAKLYRNRGNGTFADVTRDARLDRVLHGMGANFGDLDNDGWLDFYLGTGNPDLETIVPNRMFRNAEGKFFQDITTSGGFGNLQKGHGISFADLDNDGDQDVHEDMGGAFSSDVYPNVLFLNTGHGNRWLKLQLVGVKANRSAIGARIKVSIKRPHGERVIYRTVNSGGSFGCNPLRQEIGLGDAASITSVEIRWPGSGTVQSLNGLELDRCYRIREDAKTPEPVALKTFSFRLPGSSEA
ncbi:MAG TPA: CRTAC1 family protein, partial [Candidatus Limnocylindria bacterium]|nr:CRTAC1 family protein [Candidatus Limnocylindria bacterium]